jgi:hypothetical protein
MHEGMLKPVHFLPAAIVLFSILIPISAIFISFMRVFLYIGIAGFFGVLLLAFVQSFMKYKILKTSFLSMITLLIQVYAYGFGTLSGLLQTLKGNKVAKGFTKDYYK